jgi:K+-sensing histidine kinase KdpD
MSLSCSFLPSWRYNLAARVRAQAVAARERTRSTEELYLFGRKLVGTATLDDLLWATVHQIALMLKVRVVALLPEDGGLVVKVVFPPEDMLDEADLAAARWCFERNQATGRGADTLPGAKRRFMPLRTGRGAVGVAGIDSDKPGLLLTPAESRLLDALSDQAALAIDRVNLAQDIDRARLAAETDRLRAALLTSISHDLRTPLASILGSASSLVAHGQEFNATVQAGLMRTIVEEAERLNRFIGNLLDMTRLESGPLTSQTGPVDLSDVIGATVQRASKILHNHQVTNLPMVEADMVLLEQVLFNLLDNGAKYARKVRASKSRRRGTMVLWPFAFSMKATESRKPILKGFSTSSTGSAAPTASAPAPGSVLRSAVVLSRPWEAGLPPRTGPAGRGRFLRSRFRQPPRRRCPGPCHDALGRTAAHSGRRRRTGDPSLSAREP